MKAGGRLQTARIVQQSWVLRLFPHREALLVQPALAAKKTGSGSVVESMKYPGEWVVQFDCVAENMHE